MVKPTHITFLALMLLSCNVVPASAPVKAKAPEVENISLHLRLTGRVQGVGYRNWAEREASKRKVGGWIRNRRDGSVEALLIGPKNRVRAMLIAMKRGPSLAKVEGVQIISENHPVTNETDFKILKTA